MKQTEKTANGGENIGILQHAIKLIFHDLCPKTSDLGYPLGGLKHLNSLPAILERYEWREYVS